ncbi:hypothetical protein EMPS_09450 [Entomortierella parvispora]|uniref:Uncharacterized protein n=1 Tax=Entomortierella parvispora TaxID=205924 RepID=A0A9P3HI73_9FUNG|nr:hypothetical protein EMPS_09450 [Entomortierella parvispora]
MFAQRACSVSLHDQPRTAPKSHHVKHSSQDTFPSAMHPDMTSNYSSTESNNQEYVGNNPYKRKHPFQFDAEFVAALDASLKDQEGEKEISNQPIRAPSPWPNGQRPCKKAKKTMTDRSRATPQDSPERAESNFKKTSQEESTHVAGTKAATTFQPWQAATSESLTRKFGGLAGPSIIDLSSGEELVALHLGENEHKRRRECVINCGSTESQRAEVFEAQEDGNLHPIVDHGSQPSPAKKLRLGKSQSQSHLHFLGDGDSDVQGFKPTEAFWNRKLGASHRQQFFPWLNTKWNRARSTTESRQRDEADQNKDLPLDRIDEIMDSGERALVQVPRQKKLSFPDAMENFHWDSWSMHGPGSVFPLKDTHGGELVLYNRGHQDEDSTFDGVFNDFYDDGPESGVIVEELEDDEDSHSDREEDLENDGNLADDEGCGLVEEDGPLMGLEEKIMDMDLD